MSALKMSGPFKISARLLPAIEIDKCWISFDASKNYFHFDFADGQEHTEKTWNAGAMRRAHDGAYVQSAFESILSFLSACGESYRYKMSNPKSEPENLDLFPEFMHEWCYSNSDEFIMLECELQENEYITVE